MCLVGDAFYTNENRWCFKEVPPGLTLVDRSTNMQTCIWESSMIPYIVRSAAVLSYQSFKMLFGVACHLLHGHVKESDLFDFFFTVLGEKRKRKKASLTMYFK